MSANGTESGGSPRKDNRVALGRWGEETAVRYLAGAGLQILARNWRARSGELDVIAEEGETLVFVEVRTRRSAGRFGSAEESVDWRKVRQVRDTATLYLYTTKQHGRKCRFDVIAVTGSPSQGTLAVKHIPNAF
ncbi:YraN family protein [Gorillibacterium sp. sgz5001074]|uniref:YraN family protein n=1 Tax=Gorillibacterium sp. sgz5001074 TaxID=3446695 RepID=UPI003F66E2A2